MIPKSDNAWFKKEFVFDFSNLDLVSAPVEFRTCSSLACEQAPVGVQSRANGMNRERSGEEEVCRGACRHSIDAAVP